VIQGCGLGGGQFVDQNGHIMKELDQTIASFKLLRSLHATSSSPHTDGSTT